MANREGLKARMNLALVPWAIRHKPLALIEECHAKDSAMFVV
jgi:hypothetical protein